MDTLKSIRELQDLMENKDEWTKLSRVSLQGGGGLWAKQAKVRGRVDQTQPRKFAGGGGALGKTGESQRTSGPNLAA